MQKLREKGFSIVETLVAVALLVLVAFAISQFLGSSFKSAQLIEGTGECQNLASTVMDRITTLGTRDTIVNFLPSTGARRPTGSPVSFVSTWYSQDIVSTGPAPALYNSQLIVGGASAAQALLQSNIAFCNDGINGGNAATNVTIRGQELPALLPTHTLAGARAWLNIQPVSLSTSRLMSCPTASDKDTFWSRPWGGAATITGVTLPSSDIGFRVIATVAYTDTATNTPKICQTEQRFNYARDTVYYKPPGMTDAQLFVSGTPTSSVGNLRPLSGGTYLSCDTDGAGWNTISVKLGYKNLEPGSVLLCQGVILEPGVVQTGPWYSCDEVKFPGQGRSTTSSWNLTTSTITLTFPDLASETKYQLNMVAVDTAGNASTQASTVFILDGARPSIGGIAEVPVSSGPGGPVYHIGTPHDGKAQRLVSPITPKPLWGVAQIQCDGQSVEFMGSYSGSFPETWTTCSVTGTGVAIASFGGSCKAKTAAVSHGMKRVTMTAIDMCDTGGSNHIDWASSRDFAPQDLTGVKSFDNDNAKETPPNPPIPQYYEITVPIPVNQVPDQWLVMCDCNKSDAGVYTIRDPKCASLIDVGSNGCTQPTTPGTYNFMYRYIDICGRDSNKPEYLGRPAHGLYEVRGDANDACGDIPCGTAARPGGKADLTCCIRTPGDLCDTGRCYESPDPTSQCLDNNPNPPLAGNPPPANSCPNTTVGMDPTIGSDPGLWSCAFWYTCLGAPSSNGCDNIGNKPGDSCNFTTVGTCNTAGLCEKPGCGGLLGDTGLACKGNRIGAPCTIVGNPCSFKLFSTCGGALQGSCTVQPWISRTSSPTQSAAAQNSVCVDRTEACVGSVPPPPPVNPCAPNHPTIEDCNSTITDYTREYCDPVGACFMKKSCGSGWVDQGNCEAARAFMPPAQQDVTVCAQQPAPSICWATRSCGADEWASNALCKAVGKGECPIDCGQVQATGCFKCGTECRPAPYYPDVPLCQAAREAGLIYSQFCEQITLTAKPGKPVCQELKTCGTQTSGSALRYAKKDKADTGNNADPSLDGCREIENCAVPCVQKADKCWECVTTTSTTSSTSSSTTTSTSSSTTTTTTYGCRADWDQYPDRSSCDAVCDVACRHNLSINCWVCRDTTTTTSSSSTSSTTTTSTSSSTTTTTSTSTTTTTTPCSPWKHANGETFTVHVPHGTLCYVVDGLCQCSRRCQETGTVGASGAAIHCCSGNAVYVSETCEEPDTNANPPRCNSNKDEVYRCVAPPSP